jgi:pilus assembly protein CpaC
MEPENAPTILPGMEVTEPGDLDFFINGDIEGRPNVHHRSTVWYMHYRRMKRSLKYAKHHDYAESENYYIHGPHGFSE